MAAELTLEPGWLMADVRAASDRLSEWSKQRPSNTVSDKKKREAGSHTSKPGNDISGPKSDENNIKF